MIAPHILQRPFNSRIIVNKWFNLRMIRVYRIKKLERVIPTWVTPVIYLLLSKMQHLDNFHHNAKMGKIQLINRVILIRNMYNVVAMA